MTTTLAIDPSSTCTGWAIAKDGKIVNGGLIRPKASWSAIRRVEAMVDGILPLAHDAVNVVVEIPSGKQAGRIKGRAQGLTTYGMAAGAVYGALYALHDCQMIPITEAQWTGSRRKKDRPILAAGLWHGYSDQAETDKGMDLADAICLLDWWLRKENP